MNRIIPLLLAVTSFSTLASTNDEIAYVPKTDWHVYKSLNEMTGKLYINMGLEASNIKKNMFNPQLNITCTSSDGSTDDYYISSTVSWGKVLMKETSFLNRVLKTVGLPYDKKDIRYRFTSQDDSEKGVFDSQVDENKISRKVTTFSDPNGIVGKLIKYDGSKVAMRVEADSGVNYTLEFDLKGAKQVLDSGFKACSQASKYNFNKI